MRVKVNQSCLLIMKNYLNYYKINLVMMQRLIQLARPNWAADDNVTPHESIPMLIKGTKDEENFVAHFIFIPDAHGVGLEVGNPKLGKRVLPLH